MRTEEDFGFKTLVKDALEKLKSAPEEGVDPLAEERTNFNNTYAEYDKVLKNAGTLKVVQEANDADNAVCNAWRSANAFLKAMQRSPNEEAAAYAKELYGEFTKYGNPLSLSQKERLGILLNLRADLNQYSVDYFNDTGFDIWSERLDEAIDEYQTALNRKISVQSQVEVGIIQKMREENDNAYRDLIEKVNAAALYEGIEKYESFIDYMNELIDRQKTVFKFRETKNREVKT